MPVKITKLKRGGVRVSTPGGVKAKHTTLAKAKAQKRLLQAVDHGWTPTHKHESLAAKILTETSSQPTDYSPEDLARYKELWVAVLSGVAQEKMAEWAEVEKLKNNYGGHQPKQLVKADAKIAP